ncbi:MAG: hypothetical protein ACRDY2_03555 [Acidimicrobiales bacterium]
MTALKRLCALGAGFLALGLGASACGLAPYVAKVNGQVITRSYLFSELNAISGNPAYVASYAKQGVTVRGKAKGTFTTSFVDQVLNQQISVTLVHQADRKRGIKITPADLSLARTDLVSTVGNSKALSDFPKSYQDFLVRSTAEYTALEGSLANVPVTQAAVDKYYAAHRAELTNLCVSLIVLPTKAKATKVEASLHKGGNFAALAQADSQNASTGAKGGAVGCSIPQAFVQAYGPTVGKQVQSLGVGKYGPAVKVSTSSHATAYVVASVTSKTPLTETKATPIILGLQLNPVMTKLNSYLAKMGKAAKISVDPSYGRFTLKNGSPDVLAPTKPPASDLVLPTGTTTTTSGSG